MIYTSRQACAQGERMNTRRRFVIALGAGALAAPLATLSQQKAKGWRIGYLATTDPTKSPRTDAFRAGLRERGYIEGQNISIEYRWTERTSGGAAHEVRAGH